MNISLNFKMSFSEHSNVIDSSITPESALTNCTVLMTTADSTEEITLDSGNS